MPALPVLGHMELRVNILQIPVEALALQSLPQKNPVRKVPVRLLRTKRQTSTTKKYQLSRSYHHPTDLSSPYEMSYYDSVRIANATAALLEASSNIPKRALMCVLLEVAPAILKRLTE